MGIFNLGEFPQVCRMCVQPKHTEQMIPIESTVLEYDSQSLLDLLNELSFEVPKEVSELVPRVICATCFAVFEFVIQYRQRVNLLLKLLVAFAQLKLGNEAPISNLFSADSSSLVRLIKELNLCSKEDVQAQDFIDEFSPTKTCSLTTLVKDEMDIVDENTSIDTKVEDVEYCNVEYIEEDVELANTLNREPPETFTESLTEFLEESEDETKEFLEAKFTDIHSEPLVKPKPKTRMLQCLYCKYRTTSQEMFQNHVDRHEHPDDANPWKCSFAGCDAVFPIKEELMKHKKELHSKYVCDMCGLVLKHKYTLEIHLRRHKGDSKYPCQYCSTSYFTSNELKLHMSVVHLSVTDFQCNECGLAFKNKKSLVLHQKTHSEQRSFQCDTCSKTFKTSAHLRRHHNTVHKEIKFYCTMCSMSYGRKDKLRMHIEKSHNVQTYFPCDICLKSFSTADDLGEHKLHHENPKELECGICLAAFLDRKEFDGHLCITYRDDYICCGRDFKYHLQYNKHMFLVHGMKTKVRVRLASDQLLGAARASRKPVERCPKCEQVFATRKLKKDHMAICDIQLRVDEGVVFSSEIDQQQQQEYHNDVVVKVEHESHKVSSVPYQVVQEFFVKQE